MSAHAALLLLFGVVSGCSQPDPKTAFDALAAAAQAGDRATFLDGFTFESRTLVALLIDHPGRVGAISALGFPDSVRSTRFEVQEDGKLAVVDLQTGREPSERARVFMRLEDGAWRLDLVATELLWNRKWELSGGPPRAMPDWEASDSSLLDGPLSLH